MATVGRVSAFSADVHDIVGRTVQKGTHDPMPDDDSSRDIFRVAGGRMVLVNAPIHAHALAVPFWRSLSRSWSPPYRTGLR